LTRLHERSWVRLRPGSPNPVWSYDFVQGHAYRPLGRRWRKFGVPVVIDEYTRGCLALHVARHIKALEVIDVLPEVMLRRGIPRFIRSDNGPEVRGEDTARLAKQHRHPDCLYRARQSLAGRLLRELQGQIR